MRVLWVVVERGHLSHRLVFLVFGWNVGEPGEQKHVEGTERSLATARFVC